MDWWSQLLTRSNGEGAKNSKRAHLSLLCQRQNMNGNDSANTVATESGQSIHRICKQLLQVSFNHTHWLLARTILGPHLQLLYAHQIITGLCRHTTRQWQSTYWSLICHIHLCCDNYFGTVISVTVDIHRTVTHGDKESSMCPVSNANNNKLVKNVTVTLLIRK